MRRKDREMDEAFGLSVIDKARFGTVCAENYCLPLSIVRDGKRLYFHSAREGTKVEIFKTDPQVCVSFVGDVQVPDLYTEAELDEIVRDESNAGLLMTKVFTTEFESAIVKGQLTAVEERDEQIHAMKLICEKYTPSKMKYFDHAIRASIDRIKVFKIDIAEITAKRKKFDQSGEEMKWGRT